MYCTTTPGHFGSTRDARNSEWFVQARESYQNRRRLCCPPRSRLCPIHYQTLETPPTSRTIFWCVRCWDGWPCGFRLHRRSEASGSIKVRDPGHRASLKSQDPGCGRGSRRSPQLGWAPAAGGVRVLSAPRLIDGDASEPLGRMLGGLFQGEPCRATNTSPVTGSEPSSSLWTARSRSVDQPVTSRHPLAKEASLHFVFELLGTWFRRSQPLGLAVCTAASHSLFANVRHW
jgi:hypothetical protein